MLNLRLVFIDLHYICVRLLRYGDLYRLNVDKVLNRLDDDNFVYGVRVYSFGHWLNVLRVVQGSNVRGVSYGFSVCSIVHGLTV
jgi:hypothetical protein